MTEEEKQLEEIKISLLNSKNFKQDFLSLPLKTRYDVLVSLSYINLVDSYLIDIINKDPFICFNKEEFEYIFNNKEEYNWKFFLKFKFIRLVDISDKVDKKLKKMVRKNIEFKAIYLLKDPSDYVDAHYNMIDFDMFRDETLDKIISKKVLNSAYEDPSELYYLILDSLLYFFKDDKYREKYFHLIRKEHIYAVIKAFKNDELKIKYLPILKKDKGYIIASLKSDKEKIKCLERYQKKLTDREKVLILISFEEKENLYNWLGLLSNRRTLIEFLISYDYNKDKNLYLELLEYVKKDSDLSSLFMNMRHPNDELGFIIIDKIKDKNELYHIADNIPESYEYAKLIVPKLDTTYINSLIEFEDYINYYYLLHCNNNNLILESIKSNRTLGVKYNDEMYNLFKLVATNYNLNLNHLITLAKISSCEILQNVENKNIRNAINLDEENFTKYMQLFDKKNYDIDLNGISTIVKVTLHKMFKINFPDVVNAFANTMQYILSNDFDSAYYIINEVYTWLDISKYGNIGKFDLYKGLCDGNERIIVLYHRMVYDYITIKRNIYVNDKFDFFTKRCMEKTYDEHKIEKYMFRALSEDIIVNMINNSKCNLDKEEYELLSDKETVKKLIEFKKDPSIKIDNELKKHLKVFNNMCSKIFISEIEIYRIPDYLKKYVVKPTNSDNLLQLMRYINVNKLRDVIFTNDELFKNLLNHLDKYDMLGWSDRFKDIEENGDFRTDVGIVSTIINYYNIIDEKRKQKEKNGKYFTLVNELDIAEVLESDADILSVLIGKEDYMLIKSDPGPNGSSFSKKKRLEKSVKKLKVMHSRKYITVPPIDENVMLSSNKIINLKLGNTNDPINLTYGERTGSCMRMGGVADSLFDICLSNENAFHISFYDPETNKLVSRVSCFRNGNTLFMNQVRDSLISKYSNADVIEACKIISNKIIKMTKNSRYPIENVVSSYGRALVGQKKEPLNCNDIEEGYPKSFYTDIMSLGVVLASSNNGKLVPIKTNPQESERYPIGRAKIKRYDNSEANHAIKHIEALDLLYDGYKVDDIEVADRFILEAYVGEDWYVAKTIDGQIISYVQRNSLNPNMAYEELSTYEQLINSKSYGGVSL